MEKDLIELLDTKDGIVYMSVPGEILFFDAKVKIRSGTNSSKEMKISKRLKLPNKQKVTKMFISRTRKDDRLFCVLSGKPGIFVIDPQVQLHFCFSNAKDWSYHSNFGTN